MVLFGSRVLELECFPLLSALGKNGKLPPHFDAAAQGCSEKAQCKEMGQPLEDQGAVKPVA